MSINYNNLITTAATYVADIQLVFSQLEEHSINGLLHISVTFKT